MKSSGNTRTRIEVVSKNTKERREERVELHTRTHTEFLWSGDFLNLEGGDSITFKIVRRLRNFLGQNYSGCLVCGDRWSWKKTHDVEFMPNRSAFPTCEECWQNASDVEIILAAKSLAKTWLVQTSMVYYEKTKTEARSMVEAVKEQLRTRQKGGDVE